MPRIGRKGPPTTGKTTKKPASSPKKPKTEKNKPAKNEGWKPGRGRPLE